MAEPIEIKNGWWFTCPKCGLDTHGRMVELDIENASDEVKWEHAEALGGASMDFQAATDLEALCEAAKWVKEKEQASA